MVLSCVVLVRLALDRPLYVDAEVLEVVIQMIDG